ncbi:MAG: 4Fe-4S dicluster domain-containing protein [Lentisphaeria bacterium]
MMNVIAARWRQGHRTAAYPKTPPTLPERFLGRPELAPGLCAGSCRAALAACPAGALQGGDGGGDRAPVALDLGRCLFCGACAAACPDAVRFTREHSLAARQRDDLLVHPGAPAVKAAALDAKARRLFGRSLKLRQVSAGGCNACESDTNVLGTLTYDLGRFGIQFVASPRHADGLLVTGPVTENMRAALLETWQAVPEPKLLIAVGACALAGGPFHGQPEVHNGVAGLLPVDLFVPGCPPHPYTILDGLLRLLGRIP